MELLQMFNSVWFILFTTLLFFLLTYFNKYLQYWKKNEMSTPITGIWSYLRELFQIMKMPMHLAVLENYRKYGRINGTFFGLTPQLVVGDPQILKNILVKDFHMFHNRMEFSFGNPVIDKMLFILKDEDWKRIRCIMSPTFTSRRMRKMAYLVRECAEKMMEHLKKMNVTNGNTSIDCKKFLSNFAIDVIAFTAFGTKLNSLEDPNNEFVNKARRISNADTSFLFLLSFIFPKLVGYFKVDISRGSFEFMKNFVLHVIRRRDEEKTKANDFLQLLLDAQKGILEISAEDAKETEETDFKMIPKHKTMSSEELLAQCILFIFAGSDTTTNTLAFILYFMALNPQLQDKLTQEIDEIWRNNEEINFDVLAKMKYLDAVVSETLRKEPIGIQLIRQCAEDYEIPEINFTIPKGMIVGIPVYAMHQDKEFYPNPEKFDPDRFMPENRNSILPYTYFPFGEGPRHCIGMRFALMTVKMCAVHIFRYFRVLATEETKKPLEFYNGQGSIQPKKMMIGLERRN